MRKLPKDDRQAHRMVNVNNRRDPAVYALHAGDHLYGYVGSTSKNSQNRLYEHIYRARTGHISPVYQWMREVGLENVQVVDLAKESDRETREALEVVLIAQLIAEGHPLRNQIARDGRPGSMSARSRELISERWTPERRERARDMENFHGTHRRTAA
jgi:hypothetical protein